MPSLLRKVTLRRPGLRYACTCEDRRAGTLLQPAPTPRPLWHHRPDPSRMGQRQEGPTPKLQAGPQGVLELRNHRPPPRWKEGGRLMLQKQAVRRATLVEVGPQAEPLDAARGLTVADVAKRFRVGCDKVRLWI